MVVDKGEKWIKACRGRASLDPRSLRFQYPCFMLWHLNLFKNLIVSTLYFKHI
jgi:hypothetical protein